VIAPTYKTNIQNGLPVVRWDGVDDLMRQNVIGWSNLTVFIVVKVDNDPPGADAQTGFWVLGGSGQATHYPYTDSNIYDDAGSTVRKSTGNPTLSLSSAFRIYTVKSTAGEWTSWIDGTQHFTTGTNTVDDDPGAGIISLGTNSNGDRLDGDVGEMLIYDAALSSTDREAVEAYLADKWGL
jgi:hypothetical protein